MNYLKSIKLLTVLLIFSLTLVSCGDDPASSNDEDPPEFPEFENVQADLSYFDADIPTESPAHQASFEASIVAAFSQMGGMYMGSFSEANRDEADFENGTWVWTYNYNMEGQTIEVRIESEESGGETHWAMIWNYDGSEGTVEDYTMLEGTVANDGSSGTWTFNNWNTDTGEETPMMVSTWSWQDETNGEISTELYDGNGVLEGTYTYVQADTEFTVTITPEAEDEDEVVIYWKEGGGGYYQEGSTQTCWDESYAEVECN